MFEKLKARIRITKKLGLKMDLVSVIFMGLLEPSERKKGKVSALKKFYYKIGDTLKLEEHEKRYIWDEVLGNTKIIDKSIRMKEILTTRIELNSLIIICGRVIYEMHMDCYKFNKFDEETLKSQVSLLKNLFEKIFLHLLHLEEDERILFWFMILQVSEAPETWKT